MIQAGAGGVRGRTGYRDSAAPNAVTVRRSLLSANAGTKNRRSELRTNEWA
jgi:hypothetical protein